jgi:hypothetical protein
MTPEDSPFPPAWFPDFLRQAVPKNPSRIAIALIASPSLAPLWNALADHARELSERDGWLPLTATEMLLDCILTPLAMGFDAHGTVARKIRGGVNMKRRRRATSLALELADLLDEIAREPMRPRAAKQIPSLLHERFVPGVPAYFERPSQMLRRMAEELSGEPDFSLWVGLVSRKPSWRGFIREVSVNFADWKFRLRERDAVALVTALCKASGVAPPSRDAVRDALRGYQSPRCNSGESGSDRAPVTG